ncbi:C6 zinc finger domain-containing protein [Trichoderma harzianum]|uniref:C6 zinc finger domain-containing protein n=1 Tax=Trichoderma harzianum TaxID=5544 RepID=A0A0F9XSM5_TRIHA|nr:C6 zinc finger domain-containing protein [Trichoderma harzianum]
MATIDGTDIEKRYFHEFKNVAAQDNVYEPDCQLTRFFSRVCTQISHQEVAVKHTMVALGSAYQLLQQKYPAKPSSTLEDLELFTTGQYNKALSRLQRLVSTGESVNHHVLLLLICSISFICLEALRANRIVSGIHLVNGLNIIGSLPPQTFNFLNDPSAATRRSRGAVETALEDIINIFSNL